ncbi:MAG: DNA internalization-related competence protein ComEC/Rec2 [Candidatus Competibacterales bacterium]
MTGATAWHTTGPNFVVAAPTAAVAMVGLALVAVRWRSARLWAFGGAGALWVLLAAPPLASQLPVALEGVDLQVEGWIASLPSSHGRRSRFQLAVKHLTHHDRPLAWRGRLLLSLYDDTLPLAVGDRWRLTVRLSRPRGLSNPGGFDYERWLFVNDIAARGYVRPSPPPERLGTAETHGLDRLRDQLSRDWRATLEGRPFAGILVALAVGDRRWMGEDQWALLTRTGTGHLMAISGLHIGLVAAFGGVGLAALWRRTPWAARLASQRVAALGALAAAAGYAALAGGTLPTQPALVAVGLVALGLWWRRPWDPGRLLGLVLLSVLLIDPKAPLAVGFWLSFGAVAAIVYLTAHRFGPAAACQGVTLQLAISLALLPITLVVFQTLVPVGAVANLVAIPWASLVVVPLVLLALVAGFLLPPLQGAILEVAHGAVAWLWAFLTAVDSLGGAWSYPPPPLWAVGVAVPGLLWLLAPRGLPARWVGAVLLVPLLLPPRELPAPGQFWLTVLDVGEGLAVVVRTRHKVLVYDTGPRLSPGFDTGEAVLVPFLRHQGISAVDVLILSHADGQHTGGVASLLEALPVGQVLTPDRLAVPVVGAELCRRGQGWRWDGVGFQVLHPAVVGRRAPGDDHSCVLRVVGQVGSALLAGDLEARGQGQLAAREGSALAADVFVAPHQGRRPTTAGLLEVVAPQVGVFATGYRNRYGYPRPATLAVYRRAAVPLLDTGRRGALSFRWTEEGKLLTTGHRDRLGRWQASPEP